jgi:hypothetical protein
MVQESLEHVQQTRQRLYVHGEDSIHVIQYYRTCANETGISGSNTVISTTDRCSVQFESLLLHLEKLTIVVQEYQEHPGNLLTSLLLCRNLVTTV